MIISVFLNILAVIVLIGIIRLTMTPKYTIRGMLVTLFLIDWFGDVLSVLLDNVDLD